MSTKEYKNIPKIEYIEDNQYNIRVPMSYLINRVLKFSTVLNVAPIDDESLLFMPLDFSENLITTYSLLPNMNMKLSETTQGIVKGMYELYVDTVLSLSDEDEDDINDMILEFHKGVFSIIYNNSPADIETVFKVLGYDDLIKTSICELLMIEAVVLINTELLDDVCEYNGPKAMGKIEDVFMNKIIKNIDGDIK